MKIKNYILYFLLLGFLNSCFKKEEAIILPRGASTLTSIFLGETYEKELYFDFGSNSFQERQLVDWDIRFESSKDGYGVFLNNGNEIFVRKTNLTDLLDLNNNIYDIIDNKPKLYDLPNGKALNSAFGDWRTYKFNNGSGIKDGIYLIELSYKTGLDKYYAMQIIGYTDSSYYIRVNKMGDYSNTFQEIKKNTKQNFTYYSFKGTVPQIVNNAEPEKESWDIEFTKYKHIFYNITKEPFPYLVTGAISNRNNVLVAKDTVAYYYDINWEYCKNKVFSDNSDAIGYDWKSFDRSGNLTYTVNSHYNYIVKTTEGHYYKLRFLDFYNENREKGYPKFEFERIH